MPTDVQPLTNEATCLMCYGSLSLWQGVDLALLARIQAQGLGPSPANALATEGGTIFIAEDGQTMIIQ